MLEPDKELSSMFETAIMVATENKHEYITLEHFLYGMVSNNNFAEMLANFGAKVDELKQNLEMYILDDLVDISTLQPGQRPKKTNMIERMLNRAFTQVLFSGRHEISSIDCLISLFAEKHSHANYFMRKAGIEKDKFLEFFMKDHSVVEEKESNDTTVQTFQQKLRISKLIQ